MLIITKKKQINIRFLVENCQNLKNPQGYLTSSKNSDDNQMKRPMILAPKVTRAFCKQNPEFQLSKYEISKKIISISNNDDNFVSKVELNEEENGIFVDVQEFESFPVSTTSFLHMLQKLSQANRKEVLSSSARKN